MCLNIELFIRNPYTICSHFDYSEALDPNLHFFLEDWIRAFPGITHKTRTTKLYLYLFGFFFAAKDRSNLSDLVSH